MANVVVLRVVPDTNPEPLSVLLNPSATTHVPPKAPGLGRHVSHMGIGAHPDDLEFMALEGILTCYSGRGAFVGVTCTDGRGSARTGKFADYSDEEMVAARVKEQDRAADLGHYAAMVQLGHPSSIVKTKEGRTELAGELLHLLSTCRPDTVYCHNLADKHPSHVAVALATVEAVRQLPEDARPARFLGCEVWRSLDWMDDTEKVAMDVGGYSALASALAEVFETQIGGGKRYDLAVAGRRRANATFYDPHSTDRADELWYAMDLSPLVTDPEQDIAEYVCGYIERLRDNVHQGISNLLAL